MHGLTVDSVQLIKLHRRPAMLGLLVEFQRLRREFVGGHIEMESATKHRLGNWHLEWTCACPLRERRHQYPPTDVTRSVHATAGTEQRTCTAMLAVRARLHTLKSMEQPSTSLPPPESSATRSLRVLSASWFSSMHSASSLALRRRELNTVCTVHCGVALLRACCTTSFAAFFREQPCC